MSPSWNEVLGCEKMVVTAFSGSPPIEPPKNFPEEMEGVSVHVARAW